MSDSISVIKEKLSEVTSENDPFFQKCIQDERKGVEKTCAIRETKMGKGSKITCET